MRAHACMHARATEKPVPPAPIPPGRQGRSDGFTPSQKKALQSTESAFLFGGSSRNKHNHTQKNRKATKNTQQKGLFRVTPHETHTTTQIMQHTYKHLQTNKHTILTHTHLGRRCCCAHLRGESGGDDDGQGRLLGLLVELAEEEPVQHLRPPREPDGPLVLRVLQQTQRQYLPPPSPPLFECSSHHFGSIYSAYDFVQNLTLARRLIIHTNPSFQFHSEIVPRIFPRVRVARVEGVT